MNVFVLALKHVEEFSVIDIDNSELRQCSLYLTDDVMTCELLPQYYKMSDMQLQIYLKEMEGNVDEATYSLIKYIRENKKTSSLNACKIDLKNWKEIHKQHGLEKIYPFKTANKLTIYNEDTLAGYCLYDISNKPAIDSSKYEKIIDDRYAIAKYDDTKMESILAGDVCSNESIDLKNGLIFIKLYCYLDNKTLKTNKMEIVQYSAIDKKFNTAELKEQNKLLFKLRDFAYSKKQVIMTYKDADVSCYQFVFDICNKVESYTFPGLIKFSLRDLKMPTKVIYQNVELSCSSDKDISSEINKTINKLVDENALLSNQIQVYSDNMETIMKSYKKLQKICAEYVNSPDVYTRCNKELDYRLSQYQMLNGEKDFLQEQLDSKQYSYTTLAEANDKLRKTPLKLEDINIALENGTEINYDKYALLLSNDNCIYLQV